MLRKIVNIIFLFSIIINAESLAIVTKSIGTVEYKKFSEDMIELYKVPDNKNEVHEVREMLEDTSVVLALQTQVDTAFVFGNKSLEKQLIKRFKKYLSCDGIFNSF